MALYDAELGPVDGDEMPLEVEVEVEGLDAPGWVGEIQWKRPADSWEPGTAVVRLLVDGRTATAEVDGTRLIGRTAFE
jgi:hypothetical protein